MQSQTDTQYMSMLRLPESQEEWPQLYAYVKEYTTEVVWLMGDAVDGTDANENNIWQVWRDPVEDLVTVESMCWFEPRGVFRLTMNESTPDKVVRAAEAAARATIELLEY